MHLATYWFVFLLVPGANSDTFLRNYPQLFSALVCKTLFYVNMSTLFLSELIICTLSFHRALTVFFPLQLIVINSKYPRLFRILFACFISLAFLIPVVNLVFNTSADPAEWQNIAEKINLNSYCVNSNGFASNYKLKLFSLFTQRFLLLFVYF